MNIRPIKSGRDYELALQRIDTLMDAASGTPEGEELDILATIVGAYEDKHFPIDLPDPVEAILFRMEQMGLQRKDLEPLLGGRSKVSEVLNRKRGLSIRMIRELHATMNIPLENLVGITKATPRARAK